MIRTGRRSKLCKSPKKVLAEKSKASSGYSSSRANRDCRGMVDRSFLYLLLNEARMFSDLTSNIDDVCWGGTFSESPQMPFRNSDVSRLIFRMSSMVFFRVSDDGTTWFFSLRALGRSFRFASFDCFIVFPFVFFVLSLSNRIVSRMAWPIF